MTSDAGAQQTATLRMPHDAHRWAASHYWYYLADQSGDGTPRSFTFNVDDERIYFD